MDSGVRTKKAEVPSGFRGGESYAIGFRKPTIGPGSAATDLEPVRNSVSRR